jgi:hypothetical protein
MTLFAYGFAQRKFQVPRIDDGFIHAVHLLVCIAKRDMKLARPMASLAADGLSAKNRRSKPIHRIERRFDLIGMAKETRACDGTV